MDYNLAKSLYIWARGNSDRIANLETWRDESLTAIVSGKGGQVISSSANGVSVTFSSKGQTNQEWFNTLTKAIQLLANSGTGKSKQGIIS